MVTVMKRAGRITLAVLACASTGVHALQVGGNATLDARYSDNAGLTSANEQDDIIAVAGISGNVTDNEGALTGAADASLRHVNYLDNTFDAQNYLQLNAAARWEQISKFLTWGFNDYYSQASINNLAGDTPSNTEDINVARLEAAVTLRPLDRHTLTLTPSFSDYYYEFSGTDNQQTGISADWSYQIRPTVTLSVIGGYTTVKYDDSQLNPDYDNTSLSLGARVLRARADYSASIGTTKVSRDSGSDTDGMTASLSAAYKLSGQSSLNANVSSNLTDTSNIYLNSALNPYTGSFGNVQISNDVVRDSVARITYRRGGSVANFSVWTEWRKLDYKTTPLDRDLQEIGATFGYEFTARLTASLDGRYIRTKEQGPQLTDKYYQAGGQLGYGLTRKLRTYAGIQFQNRDNTDPAAGYDEFSIYAGLGYRLGRQAVSRDLGTVGRGLGAVNREP